MDQNFNFSKLRMIYAADIMNPQVAMVKPETSLGQMVHLLLKDYLSGYPVVDENKKVVGIVTMTDIFSLLNKMAAIKDADMQNLITEYKNMPVSRIMSRNVITIARHTPLSEIIDIVVKSNVHNFPVVENDQLVGIIGRHDVLSAIFVYS